MPELPTMAFCRKENLCWIVPRIPCDDPISEGTKLNWITSIHQRPTLCWDHIFSVSEGVFHQRFHCTYTHKKVWNIWGVVLKMHLANIFYVRQLKKINETFWLNQIYTVLHDHPPSMQLKLLIPATCATWSQKTLFKVNCHEILCKWTLHFHKRTMSWWTLRIHWWTLSSCFTIIFLNNRVSPKLVITSFFFR